MTILGFHISSFLKYNDGLECILCAMRQINYCLQISRASLIIEGRYCTKFKKVDENYPSHFAAPSQVAGLGIEFELRVKVWKADLRFHLLKESSNRNSPLLRVFSYYGRGEIPSNRSLIRSAEGKNSSAFNFIYSRMTIPEFVYPSC